jgi:site-specific recombinase XerD
VSIYLSTVRQFVEFCESIDAVVGGTSQKIVLPDRDRNARTEMLESDNATVILSYLRKYHYASRTHALMALLWHTGIRTGTVRALDVRDSVPHKASSASCFCGLSSVSKRLY